jgi:hypothetical protein
MSGSAETEQKVKIAVVRLVSVADDSVHPLGATARPPGATVHHRERGSGIGRWGRHLPELGGSTQLTARTIACRWGR